MNIRFVLCLVLLFYSLAGCSAPATEEDQTVRIGVMLAEIGLGDQSFNDSAFRGLMRARDTLGILFDYRELKDTGTYEKGIQELVDSDNDLIIGVGYNLKNDLEKIARKYPTKSFVLLDDTSELDNITSITFKEEEGSFLIGVIAGLKSETKRVGFIGGTDAPVIQRFKNGFEQGVHTINPNIVVETKYANTFGDDKIGYSIAKEMIEDDTDFIYPAAGFTSVGVLQAAQEAGIYSFGVDVDQYFLAEKTVVTSMVKNMDVVLFKIIEEYMNHGHLLNKNVRFGLKDGGISLAPIRVLTLTDSEKKTLTEMKNKINSNSIQINQIQDQSQN